MTALFGQLVQLLGHGGQTLGGFGVFVGVARVGDAFFDVILFVRHAFAANAPPLCVFGVIFERSSAA